MPRKRATVRSNVRPSAATELRLAESDSSVGHRHFPQQHAAPSVCGCLSSGFLRENGPLSQTGKDTPAVAPASTQEAKTSPASFSFLPLLEAGQGGKAAASRGRKDWLGTGASFAVLVARS